MDDTKAQMWAYVEDGPDRVEREFMDYVWTHHRNHMRTLIEAWCSGEGREAFLDYLESFRDAENVALGRADHQIDVERDK